jgi:TolB protein
MRRSVLPLLAAAAVLLLGTASPASAAFPGHNGVIGYAWHSSNEPELGPPFTFERALRTVAPRTERVRTVIGCRESDTGLVSGTCAIPAYRDPAFAPDGAVIAFDTGPNLALVRPDGTGLQPLPAHGVDDGEPAFSPPGGRLVFGSDGDLWVSRRDGSDARRLLARGRQPAWSTRGWIAFVRGGQIWRVRPGGRGLEQLTRRGGLTPAWSPHGTKLAFARGNLILVLDIATGRLRRAIGGSAPTDIAWSPDGRSLAWTTFEGTLWLARTNGAEARALVAGGVNATQSFGASGIDWQPRH